MSALTLALTLPDTCGNAEEPEKSTGTRYRNWCNKYVFNRESELFKEIVEEERVENYVIGNDMPYLDAEIIYKLRNSLLHQSTPNSECESKLDKFVLVVSKEECADGDVSVVEYDENHRHEDDEEVGTDEGKEFVGLAEVLQVEVRNAPDRHQ